MAIELKRRAKLLPTKWRGTLKRMALGTAAASPVLSWRIRAVSESKLVSVLNFHRIDRVNYSAYPPVHPDTFDDLIGWLRKSYDIVTFGDLAGSEPTGRPRLILSFDDGYKDFIEVVAPILASHEIRVNQNVIPMCVATGRPPFTVLMQDFIGSAPRNLLSETPLPGLPAGADSEDRVRSGLIASAVLKNRPISQQKEIIQSLERSFQRFDDFCPTRMMSLADVQEMGAVHEIGCHSMEHASMAFETDEYLEKDVLHCRKWFQEATGRMPRIYAFPNGSARPEQAKIVRDAGFEYVLLVENGFSKPCDKVFSRLSIYGETLSELKFRSLGGVGAVKARRVGKGGVQ